MIIGIGTELGAHIKASGKFTEKRGKLVCIIQEDCPDDLREAYEFWNNAYQEKIFVTQEEFDKIYGKD